jgi:hypothetical protein
MSSHVKLGFNCLSSSIVGNLVLDKLCTEVVVPIFEISFEGFELTTLVVIMVIVCKHVLVMNTDYIMISIQSGSNSNATDAPIEAGIAHPSGYS